jgi:hypothetical protein
MSRWFQENDPCVYVLHEGKAYNALFFNHSRGGVYLRSDGTARMSYSYYSYHTDGNSHSKSKEYTTPDTRLPPLHNVNIVLAMARWCSIHPEAIPIVYSPCEAPMPNSLAIILRPEAFAPTYRMAIEILIYADNGEDRLGAHVVRSREFRDHLEPMATRVYDLPLFDKKLGVVVFNDHGVPAQQ